MFRTLSRILEISRMSKIFKASSRTSKALSNISLKKIYILLISKYSNILILLDSTSLYKILLIISYKDTITNKGKGTFK
jgi:hypothetical protein